VRSDGPAAAVGRVAALPAVAAALEWVDENADACRAETVAIAEVPAPTFAEERRAALVERRLRELGAVNVDTFGHGNIAGRIGPDGIPGLVLTARLLPGRGRP
jgi:hypothetical protein